LLQIERERRPRRCEPNATRLGFKRTSGARDIAFCSKGQTGKKNGGADYTVRTAADVAVRMTHGRAEWHSWQVWMNGIATCGTILLVARLKFIGVHRVRPRDLHTHVKPSHTTRCQHAPLCSLLYMWA
jgi:hypothetical protein